MTEWKRVIAVDVETTGMSVARGGRVIEIGAVAIENGSLTSEFHSLIDAKAPILAGAYRVHGISGKMLEGSPEPAHAWARFRDFVADSPLLAHNSAFDGAFVQHELGRLEHLLPNHWYCTLKLARKRLPHLPNHKLETVARHLLPDLPPDLRLHRALDDARLTARIWVALAKG